MGRKFFITGGTGLIGRALVRALLRQRDLLGIEQITLLSRNPERFRATKPEIANADGVRFIQGDMSTGGWPQESFTDVIHGATDVNDLLVSDRLAYAWSIVEGTKRILDYAERAGSERFLYLSSGAVYGPGPYPDAGIPETWPTAPALDTSATAYGQAKRYSEHLCALFAERTSVAVRVARIFSVIGPEVPLNSQYALGNFVRDVLNDNVDCLRVKGDGLASRSYMHINDVAAWLIAINERADRGETFNVGSGYEITIADLAMMIRSIAGSVKEVIVEGALADYGGRSRYFPDCGAIRTALGLGETVTIQRSIQELLAHNRLPGSLQCFDE